MASDFLILGHRGARNRTYFQNSMSAFREALEAADGFETDTAISRDGVIYLVHDITYIHTVDYTLASVLDPASAGRIGGRRIDQMESGEIDTLRLQNGEPVPKLKDVITLFRDKPDAILNLEIKGDDNAPGVLAFLREIIQAGVIGQKQVILSSFNFPALAWLRKAAPEFKLCVLFSLETQGRERLYPWSSNLEGCYTPFKIRELATPILHAIDPDFFNLSLATMSISNIAAIIAAFPKARFMVWALSEPSEAEAPHILTLLGELTAHGWLYAWITDEPRLRKAALSKFIT